MLIIWLFDSLQWVLVLEKLKAGLQIIEDIQYWRYSIEWVPSETNIKHTVIAIRYENMKKRNNDDDDDNKDNDNDGLTNMINGLSSIQMVYCRRQTVCDLLYMAGVLSANH